MPRLTERYETLLHLRDGLPPGPERSKADVLLSRLQSLLERSRAQSESGGAGELRGAAGSLDRLQSLLAAAEPATGAGGADAFFDGGRGGGNPPPLGFARSLNSPAVQFVSPRVRRFLGPGGRLLGHDLALADLLATEVSQRPLRAHAAAAELLAALGRGDPEGKHAELLGAWALKALEGAPTPRPLLDARLFVDARERLYLFRAWPGGRRLDPAGITLGALWRQGQIERRAAQPRHAPARRSVSLRGPRGSRAARSKGERSEGPKEPRQGLGGSGSAAARRGEHPSRGSRGPAGSSLHAKVGAQEGALDLNASQGREGSSRPRWPARGSPRAAGLSEEAAGPGGGAASGMEPAFPEAKTPLETEPGAPASLAAALPSPPGPRPPEAAADRPEEPSGPEAPPRNIVGGRDVPAREENGEIGRELDRLLEETQENGSSPRGGAKPRPLNPFEKLGSLPMRLSLSSLGRQPLPRLGRISGAAPGRASGSSWLAWTFLWLLAVFFWSHGGSGSRSG